MYFFGNITPEFYYDGIGENCDSKKYLVKLSGGITIATRSNKHWYGMGRWLRDHEVLGWAPLEIKE